MTITKPAQHQIGLGFILTGLCCYALYLRWPAINPPSLWSDDAWVGLSAKAYSLQDLRLATASSPILFSALMWVIYRIIPDPEISIQMLPLVCSIIQIPAIYLFTSRLTGSPMFGLLAGYLIASAENLVMFSARAKQYSVDSFCVICLLLLTLHLLSRPGIRRLLYLAGCSVATLGLSYTSILVSISSINLFAFSYLFSRETPRRNKVIALGICLTFNLLCLLFYIFILKDQENQKLHNYWARYYIPTAASLPEQAMTMGLRLVKVINSSLDLRKVFPSGRILVMACIFCGIWHAGRRSLLLCVVIVLIYAQLAGLAWLRLYPMGGGRTDIFTFPASIILFTSGLHWLHLQAHSLALPFSKYPLQVVTGTAICILCFLPVRYQQRARYPKDHISKVIKDASPHVDAADAIILHPAAFWGFGYYTTWPVEFAPAAGLKGFRLTFPGRSVFKLPPAKDPLKKKAQGQISDALDSFLKPGYRCVHYWESQDKQRKESGPYTLHHLERAGYALKERIKKGRSSALSFCR